VTHQATATTGRQPAAGRSSVTQSSGSHSSAKPTGTTRTLLKEDGGVIRRTTLPSGLRVISEQVPGQRSATIGVWFVSQVTNFSPFFTGSPSAFVITAP